MKQNFLFYGILAAGLTAVVLMPQNIWGKDQFKIEVYSGGEKFPSLNQYRLHRRMVEWAQDSSFNAVLAEPTPVKAEPPIEGILAESYLDNFLSSMLKSFNDKELRQILHELRIRRPELFQDGGRDYSLEMREMFNQRQEESKEYRKLELDPSRVKTIMFSDDETSQKSLIFGDSGPDERLQKLEEPQK